MGGGGIIDSDHYLIISKIRGRISNATKLHRTYSKKLNCKKLKEPEIAATYVDRLDECLAGWNDSENVSVSERLESLKNIITTTSDSALGKVGKVKYEDWCDAECEHATTLKNRAYERMHQRNHTRNAVEEYRVARRQEKSLHKKKKRKYNEDKRRDLGNLRSINESRTFYQELNKSQKDFKLRDKKVQL
jgi:hypothetical protein